METATIEQIDERLRDLPPEQLATVLDFVTFLMWRQSLRDDTDLEADYRAMAADEEREREALEWIECAPDEALE
jgi:hypothetical protein